MVAAAAAKSLQSCPTLCNPIDGTPPDSPVPGILQARTLEWVAIFCSNAWKWSHSVVSDSSWPHGLQPTRLLHPWDFPGKSTGVGCHHLLRRTWLDLNIYITISIIIIIRGKTHINPITHANPIRHECKIPHWDKKNEYLLMIACSKGTWLSQREGRGKRQWFYHRKLTWVSNT